MGSFIRVPIVLPVGVSFSTCSFQYVLLPGRLSKKEAERIAFSEELPRYYSSTYSSGSSLAVEYDFALLQSQFSHFGLTGTTAALTVLTFVSDSAPYMQGQKVASSFVFCVRPTRLVAPSAVVEKKKKKEKKSAVHIESFALDTPYFFGAVPRKYVRFPCHLFLQGLDEISHAYVYVSVLLGSQKILRLRQQLPLESFSSQKISSLFSHTPSYKVDFSFDYPVVAGDPSEVDIVLRFFDSSFTPLAETMKTVSLSTRASVEEVPVAALAPPSYLLYLVVPEVTLSPSDKEISVPLVLTLSPMPPPDALCVLYRRVTHHQRDTVTLFSLSQPLLPSMKEETTDGLRVMYPYSFVLQKGDENSELEVRIFTKDHTLLASATAPLSLKRAASEKETSTPSFYLQITPSKIFFSSRQEGARVLYTVQGSLPSDASLRLHFVSTDEYPSDTSFPLPQGEITFTRSSLLSGAVRQVRLVPYIGNNPFFAQAVSLPVLISPFISSVALSFIDVEDARLPFWTKDVVVGDTLECTASLLGDTSQVTSVTLHLGSLTYPLSSFLEPYRFTISSSAVGALELQVIAHLLSGEDLISRIPLFVRDLQQDPSSLVSEFSGPEHLIVNEIAVYSVDSTSVLSLYFAALPLDVSAPKLTLPADVLSSQLRSAEIKGEIAHHHFSVSYPSVGSYVLVLYTRLSGVIRLVTQKIVMVTPVLDYTLAVSAQTEVGQEVVARIVSSSGAPVPLLVWSVNFLSGTGEMVPYLTHSDAATATFVFSSELDHLRVWIFARLYDATTGEFLQVLSGSINVGEVTSVDSISSFIDGPDEAVVGQEYSFSISSSLSVSLPPLSKLLFFSLESPSLPSQRQLLRPLLSAGATFSFRPEIVGHCSLALLTNLPSGDLQTVIHKKILVHPSPLLLGPLMVAAHPHIIHFSESSIVSITSEPDASFEFAWFMGTPEGEHHTLAVSGPSFAFQPQPLSEDQDTLHYSLYAEVSDASGQLLGPTSVVTIQVLRQHPQAYFARQHMEAQRHMLLDIRNILASAMEAQSLTADVETSLKDIRRNLRDREHRLATLVADWPARFVAPALQEGSPLLEFSALALFGDIFRKKYLHLLFKRIHKKQYVAAFSFLMEHILGTNTEDDRSLFWRRYRFIEHYESEFLKRLAGPSAPSGPSVPS